MDPDQALKDLRAAIATLRELAHADSTDAEIDAAHDVANAAEALDEWCTRGGFLPDPWASHGRTVFVATISTAYEVVAVATTEQEAVDLVADKAYQHLKAVGAVYPETDSPAKVAEYLGVSLTAVAVGAAEFVGNE